MAITFSQYNNVLKQYYADSHVDDLTLGESPLYALMPKDPKVGGVSWEVAVKYGQGQGISADFTRAQTRAQSSPSAYARFSIPVVKKYGLTYVPQQAVLASRDKATAYFDVLTNEIDGKLTEIAKQLSVDLYRAGYGKIGAINSAVGSATTIVLSNPSDINNFEVGMELEVAATETGTSRALGSSGNGLLITGVNVSTFTLTFGFAIDDATNGIPTIANGDSLFVRGSHNGSTAVCVSGLDAWIPTTAPGGSDSFFGQNRSVSSRLYGLSADLTGLPLPQALRMADQQVSTVNGKISHFFMHTSKWAELADNLESKMQISNERVNATISFKSIELMGMNNNVVKLIADRSCPVNRVYGLELSSWKLGSYGKAIRPFDLDGRVLRYSATSDDLENRAGFYGNVACYAPGHNIVIQVAA